jgi:hypothetical protein
MKVYTCTSERVDIGVSEYDRHVVGASTGVFWHNERQRQLCAVKLPTIVLPDEHPEARETSSRPPVRIHDHTPPLQNRVNELSIEHKFLVPVCLETGKNGRGYRSGPSQKISEYPKSTCCDEGVQLRGRGDATGVAIERLSSHVSSEKTG